MFGAGGGIGGSICELLHETPGIDVVACVRNWASAVRLARRGMELSQCDIANPDQVTMLVKGADVIINAAMLAPLEEAKLVSNLFDAGSRAGVGRFVQLSSAVVYGEQLGEVNEAAPLAPTSVYARGKVSMERALCKAAGPSETRVVILRPSIVYGPFSDAWTVRYAQRIALGKWKSLGGLGRGVCNAIYTYDLARCAIKAAAHEAAPKTPLILNVNGADFVSWNDYIERFGAALAIDDRIVPNAFALEYSIYAGETLRAGGAWIKGNFASLFSKLAQSKSIARSAIDGAKSVGKLYPSLDECRLLRRNVSYSSRRAAEVLRFEPSTSLSEGLQMSANWCRTHGITG